MNNLKDKRFDQITQPIVVRYIDANQQAKKAAKPVTVIIIISMALIISAEVVTTFFAVLLGAILNGILLIGLANLYYFSREQDHRRVYLAFALVPLLRILSLAMPIPHIPLIFWLVLIGLPLSLSAALAIRINGLSTLRLNLSWMEWTTQLMYGFCGIPLGQIASYIVTPKPIVTNHSPGWIILGGVVLTLFSGITEEIIFRGLVQNAISYSFGFFSFFFSSILYTSMFLGTLSPVFILFYGITGLLFAFWVQISDSLWGVILAHSMMNVVFLLLFPLH